MSDSKLEPSIIVIFGITGDLSKRYLLPALYHLFKDEQLHPQTKVIGLTRQVLTSEELFGQVELCIHDVDNVCDPVALKKMQSQTELLQFDPSEASEYPKLLELLNEIEAEQGICMNRLYYLSIPPALFTDVVHSIGAAGLSGSCQHGKAATRLLVEKPFGQDTASARELVVRTNQSFAEEQVFRIDHYLAKETVQNILTFRAHNPIFASIWDSAHVTDISIIASEKIGIENRRNFYEGIGALRDLIQSHLLQLAAVVTMELPAEITSDTIHAAKLRALQQFTPADPAKAKRGQYESYRTEVKNNNSTTETFAAISLSSKNKLWGNTNITIATGKALAEKRTEIVVTFTNPADDSDASNILSFHIQPNEGIRLQLRVKQPGFEHQLESAVMDFSYATTFGDGSHPNAYERVLVDAIKGDRTLFASSDEVMASWKIIEPIIENWQSSDKGMVSYAAGSFIEDLLHTDT